MSSAWRTASSSGNKFKQKVKLEAGQLGSQAENEARRSLLRLKQTRKYLPRPTRAKLKTLENPLLYSKFVKKLGRLNPDFDFELVDRTLEPEEALNDLRRKFRDIILEDRDSSSFGSIKEYRDWLFEQGIESQRLQDLVIRDDIPPTEQEIGMLSYAVNGRSKHAIMVDKSLKARPAKTFRQYANDPNRYDVAGIDRPAKSH